MYVCMYVFFWSEFFLGVGTLPKNSLTKFFLVKKMLSKFFMILDLESRTWDSGFRIWGSGSVTWDSGFRIQDLGLRIWDLDSSWPTDPFDQLDVAQLSKIFFFIMLLLQMMIIF